MILSIPLFSPPLLLAALLIGLGLLITPISVRLSVIGIGLGSIIMGAVLFTRIPAGFELHSVAFFGMTILVGAWMMFIGMRHP